VVRIHVQHVGPSWSKLVHVTDAVPAVYLNVVFIFQKTYESCNDGIDQSKSSFHKTWSRCCKGFQNVFRRCLRFTRCFWHLAFRQNKMILKYFGVYRLHATCLQKQAPRSIGGPIINCSEVKLASTSAELCLAVGRGKCPIFTWGIIDFCPKFLNTELTLKLKN
jgi:hypothetical protein